MATTVSGAEFEIRNWIYLFRLKLISLDSRKVNCIIIFSRVLKRALDLAYKRIEI